MKILFSVFVLAVFINACTSSEKNSGAGIQRIPTSGPVTSGELQQWGAVNMLMALKNHCCNGVMVEKSDVSFWGDAEIAELQKYVDDPTPAAPVYRLSSPVMCLGAKFTSSVGREARHLIEAIKKKTYPLAQCSTYDLRLPGQE